MEEIITKHYPPSVFTPDLTLWRWLQSQLMEKKRERNDLTPITTCISPLWKDTTTNNVVTLRMPPPQTQFTSLDTFMAAHSPRRFCQARQKYILSKYSMQLSLILRSLPANSLKHCIDFNTQNLYTLCSQRKMFIFFVCLLEEPLTVDKRITEAGYVPVQQKTRNYSE